MADKNALAALRTSREVWRQWRWHDEGLRGSAMIDLTGADLAGIDIGTEDFGEQPVDMTRVDLSNANLAGSNLQSAQFTGSILQGANLLRADLSLADLAGADLRSACLVQANLFGVSLAHADLSGADLTGADLTAAHLRQTDLRNATLDGCQVYGVAVWDTDLTGSIQRDLRVSPGTPTLTTDNIEVAQFLHLLLSNPKIRSIVETLTAKTVLILGRFAPERKQVLDALRDALRARGLVPIVFDFDGPDSRDVAETVRTLAHLSRFIVADLTDPRSVPHELATIIPLLPSVPVRPVIQASEEPWGMFASLERYEWVIRPPYRYTSAEALISSIDEHILAPAEAAVARSRASIR
jgi:hypothetical protein